MTEQQFQAQMNRLAETYGKSHYGGERTRILWAEIEPYSAGWFQETVTGMIAGSRQAPMISEFRMAIAAERERVWKVEKSQSAEEVRKFRESLGAEDMKMLFERIIDRMRGRMGDPDFKQFQSALRGISTAGQRMCRYCEDDGVVFCRFAGNDHVYRCFCAEGRKRRERYPVFDPVALGVTVEMNKIGVTIILLPKNQEAVKNQEPI